jgi:hypothetical protein
MLNMEFDLQSLFGLLCTAVHTLYSLAEAPQPPPPPSRIWSGLIYEGAIGQPKKRHLFVTPCIHLIK